MKQSIYIFLICALGQNAYSQIPEDLQLALNQIEFELYSTEDCDNSEMFFIDSLGMEVFDQKFNSLTGFYGEYANIVLNGISGILKKSGSFKLFEEYDKVFWHNSIHGIALKDSLYGCIDTSGKATIPFIYEDMELFNHGFASVNFEGKRNFININNTLVFPDTIILEKKGIFNNLLLDSLTVYEGYCNETGGSIIGLGFINLDNKYLTKPCYKIIYGHFFDDIVHVQKNELHGFLNVKGEEQVPLKYRRVGKQREGLIPFLGENKWGYINYSGKEIIPPTFDKASEFSEGLAIVTIKDSTAYINKRGDVEIQYGRWTPHKYHGKFSEGLAVVKRDSKWVYIDELGKQAFNASYEKARSFKNGFACIQMNGKWGVINKNGELIIEPKYDEIWNYEDQMFRVKNEKQ